jgi:Phage tail tube protein, GTA-gp10
MTAARTLSGARANRHRGEVEAIIDGERRILCLTLGSLAELETAFGAESLTELAARFTSGRLSAADIIRILGAGLRGGGNLMGEDEVAAMTVAGGLAGAARLVADLLAATFGTDAADDDPVGVHQSAMPTGAGMPAQDP